MIVSMYRGNNTASKDFLVRYARKLFDIRILQPKNVLDILFWQRDLGTNECHRIKVP